METIHLPAFLKRAVLLPRGHLTMCEDTSDRHNWEMLLHLESDRDAAQHPLKSRKPHSPTAPARKNYQPLKSLLLKLENLQWYMRTGFVLVWILLPEFLGGDLAPL